MIGEKLQLSKDKSVLKQLLDAWGINYTTLAKELGVTYKYFWQYKSGNIPFKMSIEQARILDKRLETLGLRFSDLPDDWIIEKTKIGEGQDKSQEKNLMAS